MLMNDALEINAFDLAQKAMEAASFNDEMKTYVVKDLLMGRLKLIQHSGSYRLVKKIVELITISKCPPPKNTIKLKANKKLL